MLGGVSGCNAATTMAWSVVVLPSGGDSAMIIPGFGCGRSIGTVSSEKLSSA